MRAPFLGLLAMALLGCFDPASPSGSGTDGSQDSSSGGTGGGCSPGSSGCPCYGNATCDAGLACNATVELCIPEDCDPGSAGCTCNEGACLTGLECSAGVCVTPGATTDPGTTDPVTTDPVTTDPVTTDPATTDPATTDPATTDPATTDPATTDPGTTDATDTDPTSPCAGDCATCLQCAVGGGTVCDDPAVVCGGDQACTDLFMCCSTGDAELCALCCADYPDGVPAFNALAACVNDNLLCPDCGIPTC
jgi:hypothetical protein